MESALEVNSPAIMQVSKSARKYAGPIFIKMFEAELKNFLQYH